MDGEAWNDCYRAIEIDQRMVDLPCAHGERHFARKAKVSIKPRIQQDTSIHLNAPLGIVLVMDVSIGFGFKAGTISMCPNDARAAFGDCFSAKLKRNNG